MDIRPLLQITTVLMAAGAFAYFGIEHWRGHDDAGPAAGSSGADYLVDGLSLWQSDERGRLLRHVTGSRLSHEPAPERYRLSDPVIVLYRDGRPQWHLTGTTADSPDPGRDVWLNGNVVAVRDAGAGEPVRLETARLHANPGANLLQAPGRVDISSRHGHWTGTGLESDLNAHTLNFSSAVEVQYAPSR